MAFFDHANISPKPYNKIKLQDFGNDGSGAKHGRDGSGQYAKNKNAILCFLSNYEWDTKKSDRLVTFKGFIEDFKINHSLNREVKKDFWSSEVVDYLKSFTLSYSLTFNVIAHSVNEARSNMARYSELLRVLTFPWDPNDSKSKNGNKFANSYVLLSNLISNGYMWKNYNNSDFKINNDSVLKFGLPVAVKGINMTIDTDAGFFEYDGQFNPKAFKISMELSVPNLLQNQHPDWATIPYGGGDEEAESRKIKTCLLRQFVGQAFDDEDGDHFLDFYNMDYEIDTRGFPFNVPVREWDFGQEEWITSRSINKLQNPYSANKSILFGVTPDLGTVFDTDEFKIKKDYINSVQFEAYLENFSLKSEQTSGEFVSTSDGSPTTEPTFDNKVIYTYEISLNIPAASVLEAKYNCIKLCYFYRMISIIENKAANKVLFGNLIKSPKEKGNNLTYSATEINNKGLLCYFHGADLNIDLEAGFFEEGGFLYPKALGLTMTIKASNNQLGKLIYELNNKNHLVNKVDSINWPLGITYDNVLTSSVAAAETLGE
jgi:hypothetical protein